MKPSIIFAIIFTLGAGAILAVVLLLQGHTFAVLEPAGLIAAQERSLLITATLLTLIVVIPILALTFFFAWWYRAGNKGARYTPNEEHGAMAELVWWAIPFEIVLVLGALTWTSTHELDPYKKLAVLGHPLTVQVVALQWKWLFIYPEQHIATVNFLALPIDRPVEFHITSDAPMNSFWIPQLGGQIYAMAGMSTKLHLVASKAGTYAGGSANYSGDGFAQMKFKVIATSEDAFDAWVRGVQTSSGTLTLHEYSSLADPSTADPPSFYGTVEDNLYTTILMKFMQPSRGMPMHGIPREADPRPNVLQYGQAPREE
ncbi:MAG TPA: ubiquinol oxidase subunit II [Candidatus Paceibacterota bacterium]